MFRRVRDSILRRPHGGILGRSQSWGQCPSPKPLGHRATRQFMRNLTYMYFLPQGSLWMFRRLRDSILRRPHGGILGRSQSWGQCLSPKPLGHRATQTSPKRLCSMCLCVYGGVLPTEWLVAWRGLWSDYVNVKDSLEKPTKQKYSMVFFVTRYV